MICTSFVISIVLLLKRTRKDFSDAKDDVNNSTFFGNN